MLDFVRLGCAVPRVKVGDVIGNVQGICEFIRRADREQADILVFPELALTGYTCADLFFQEKLLEESAKGLQTILTCSAECPRITAAIGLPVQVDGRLYNAAAVISGGILRGLAVKSFLPNHNEFYERRWFSPADYLLHKEVSTAQLGLTGDYSVPIGSDLMFRLGDGAVLGVEICEDLWTPVPPSALMAVNGAEMIVNLSASNEIIGKKKYRRELVKHQSAGCSCVYAFCSAGCTESTQDLVFGGHSLIAENGRMLAEQANTPATDYLLITDADLGRIRADRRKSRSMADAAERHASNYPMRIVDCGCEPLRSDGSLREVDKLPFVPGTRADRQERCQEIFNIQAAGLCQRLSLLNAKAVVGISGGLDSTLALLVSVEAMRRLGRPMTDIIGVTMPCFGTSDRTYQNALAMMEALGVTVREVNIRDAVTLHFRDIGHDLHTYDGTYENAQARERTQVLMDIAGMEGGIVIGTGDLSELALGWCTYNGDQMSMYGVNASIPKTLIRWMIEAISEMPGMEQAKSTLLDVLDTPISPELLPPNAEGKISQYTEDLVGPYALHDFYLYYMLRFGFGPKKIYALACRAFSDDFEPAEIKKWLIAFYRRFFTQQFKRSCMPDGVKVGSVCLSPRGDWRMPSDAAGRIWLEEAQNL